MIWAAVIEKNDGKKVIRKGVTQHIKIGIDKTRKTTDFYVSVFAFGSNRLRLIAEYWSDENRIHIIDIEAKKEDRNCGYGSTAMEILFEIGLHADVEKYTGYLSEHDLNDPDDPEHKDRLVHFYRKYGFIVDLEEKHIERTVNISNAF